MSSKYLSFRSKRYWDEQRDNNVLSWQLLSERKKKSSHTAQAGLELMLSCLSSWAMRANAVPCPVHNATFIRTIFNWMTPIALVMFPLVPWRKKVLSWTNSSTQASALTQYHLPVLKPCIALWAGWDTCVAQPCQPLYQSLLLYSSPPWRQTWIQTAVLPPQSASWGAFVPHASLGSTPSRMIMWFLCQPCRICPVLLPTYQTGDLDKERESQSPCAS